MKERGFDRWKYRQSRPVVLPRKTTSTNLMYNMTPERMSFTDLTVQICTDQHSNASHTLQSAKRAGHLRNVIHEFIHVKRVKVLWCALPFHVTGKAKVVALQINQSLCQTGCMCLQSLAWAFWERITLCVSWSIDRCHGPKGSKRTQLYWQRSGTKNIKEHSIEIQSISNNVLAWLGCHSLATTCDHPRILRWSLDKSIHPNAEKRSGKSHWIISGFS